VNNSSTQVIEMRLSKNTPSYGHMVKKSSTLKFPTFYFKSKINIYTMKTSNSSRHRNGISTTSQRASIKQTVENERSPPDNERVSL